MRTISNPYSFIHNSTSMKFITFLLLAVFAQSLLASDTRYHEYEQSIDAASIVMVENIKPSADNGYIYSLRIGKQSIQFKLFINDDLQNKLDANTNLLVLKGNTLDKPNTWARFVNQNGKISGAYYDGENFTIIEAASRLTDVNIAAITGLKGELTQADDSQTLAVNFNAIEHNGTCGLNTPAVFDEFSAHQSSFEHYLGHLQAMTANATGEINITLIADTEFVSASSDASTEMINNLNVADGIFSEQLGVSIKLFDTVELSNNGSLTSSDPITLIQNLVNVNIPNPGLRHLFTGKNLNGSTVGIAYVGSLCGQFSVGITQRIGALTSIVFAHELGHNFGAPHDNQSGSVCASTPSGFIMNPNVNGAGDEFSNCSVDQMLPFVDAATNGPFACIEPITPVVQAPVIISTPNLSASVGNAYSYDADNTVEVEDNIEVSFNLDIAPDGMEISNEGEIIWTPTEDDLGTVAVQISVTNAGGSDTQFFEIEVSSNAIDFSQYSIDSFASNQDQSGGVVNTDNNFALELEGNTWKSIAFDYAVTSNTILEFDYSSDIQAEIHGIGFDNKNEIDRSRTFKLHGSQRWGIEAASYTNLGSVQSIRIPVGLYFTGEFDRLVFMVDNDRNISGANARFSNVRIYEDAEPGSPAPDVEPVDFNTVIVSPHLPDEQNISGSVEIIEDGAALSLRGNLWQKLIFDNRQVTPGTIIEFEFKSDAIGDIHGIGILPGNTLERDRSFKLYGTQTWGRSDFSYTADGEYQRFVIPVGAFFTSNSFELVFINDHDVNNPDANSVFRNLKVYE
uniref:M12 family metallo-peptidase n=1 Tax=Ningiella ruwaisensis TaxID=2364274 RepID=UPI0019D550A6|nr:M12 family metallo-peptidase [Ningiella ruwaisensis]